MTEGAAVTLARMIEEVEGTVEGDTVERREGSRTTVGGDGLVSATSRVVKGQCDPIPGQAQLSTGTPAAEGWRARLPASEIVGKIRTGVTVRVIVVCDSCASCGWLPMLEWEPSWTVVNVVTPDASASPWAPLCVLTLGDAGVAEVYVWTAERHGE